MQPANLNRCAICGAHGIPPRGLPGLVCRYECERCGTFHWPPTMAPTGERDERVRLSGFSREQNEAGLIPEFTPDLKSMVLRRPIPRFTGVIGIEREAPQA